ncbi:MAG TPA: citrate synthase [Candidatus Kryptonia bacterium]|nr:citrate synthase [Candidatus Kryptonia bacterium]
MSAYFSAAEAAAELEVNLPTLYAYVSRGLIRSEAAGDGRRRRRYVAEDIWLLKQRKQHRRDPSKAAQEALHWGMPVLESRLSVIHGGRLYYAGRDVVTLAQHNSLEQVAALLWMGDLNAPFPDDVLLLPEWRTLAQVASALPPLEGLQVFLPVAAAHDPYAYDIRPAAVQRAGARILRLLAAAAVRSRPSAEPIARVLQRRWAPKCPEIAALLQTALVLYADNGLNPSSFTARCVASAGSTPYALVAAGLAALQGSKHGGACERAQGLLDEVREARGAQRAVMARMRRGETVPGFGHPLYPAGDPRGAFLLQLVGEHRAKSPEVKLALALSQAVRELMNEHPTVDFGVVTLCRALDLPPEAALSLLGVGRIVGWIAHGLEQYQEGREIRPRARYAGDLPAVE